MKSNRGHISLSLDCSNAFGSVQRPAMVEGAKNCGAQELLPTIRAMYASESVAHVRVTDGSYEKISISRGVRQGDSLGPAIFAVALLPILEECRGLFPGARLRSYHDDVNVCGPPHEVYQAFAFLKPKLSAIGLQLNPAKSNILVNVPLAPEAFAPFEAEGFKPPSTSLELLGSIIGDERAIRAFLARKDVDFGEALETLDYAMSKGFSRHIIFKLLRFCAAARNAHLFRTISPEHTDYFAEAITTRTTNAFYRLAHGFLEKNQEVEVPLNRPICDALLYAPTGIGGVGMPDARVSRLSSYISSLCRTAKLGGDTDESREDFLNAFPGFATACKSLVDDAKHADEASQVEQWIALCAPNLESNLGTLVHKLKLDGIMDALPPLAKIHIISSRLSEAATPFLLDHSFLARLNDPSFCLAALMRVSYPFHPHRKVCALCNTEADETAVHDLVCQKSIEKRVSNRHSHIQNTIASCLGGKTSAIDKAKWSLINAQVNYADFFDAKAVQPVAFGGQDLDEEDDDTRHGQHQPPQAAPVHQKYDVAGKISHPDILIIETTTQDLTDGKTTLVDVTITGPNNQNRKKALLKEGAMALCAEERKTRQVNARWHTQPKPGFRFVPFAIENTGGLGSQARELIYQMLDIPKAPPLQAHSAEAVNRRLERNDKFDALLRIKAAITAAVWKGNQYIYIEYTRSLKAVIPPPGEHLVEMD
jgi:hypothetical protein